jgi:hypothetical protein
MKKIYIGLFFLSVIVITFILFLQMKKRPTDKKASLAAGKQLYTTSNRNRMQNLRQWFCNDAKAKIVVSDIWLESISVGEI